MVAGLLADALSGGIAGFCTGIGNLAKDLREAITGEIPAAQRSIIEQKLMEMEFLLEKAQTDVNLVEARHPNIFVAGWRPFIGWVCGVAIAYNFVLNPLIIWISKLYGSQVVPPVLDVGSLMTLVLSLLGLGGMRSYEKRHQVVDKH